MFSMKHELKCELLSKNLRSLLLATGPTALKHEHVCLQWLGARMYFLEHGGQD